MHHEALTKANSYGIGLLIYDYSLSSASSITNHFESPSNSLFHLCQPVHGVHIRIVDSQLIPSRVLLLFSPCPYFCYDSFYLSLPSRPCLALSVAGFTNVPGKAQTFLFMQNGRVSRANYDLFLLLLVIASGSLGQSISDEIHPF